MIDGLEKEKDPVGRELARLFILAGLVLVFNVYCGGGKPEPIKLGTYPGTRVSATHLLYVSSPWNRAQYMAINFPEHCWGVNLPNISHDSPGKPIPSPWRFNADSTEAVFEYQPRPGVLFRAEAVVDSMAVKLSIRIDNRSDTPIKNIRTLVCNRPDHMAAFRDTSYSRTYVAVNGRGLKLGTDTHFRGELPKRGQVNWGLNIAGGPDNRRLEDIGWFRTGPGRIVEERADPPLIAIHSSADNRRWIAAMWRPARVLFVNPAIPCFHSDPLPPDCPPGGTSLAKGAVFFHEGTFATLVARARSYPWLE